MSRRSELLETSRILETAALDPYEFVRDAYLQRRRNLVYDGNPPEDNDIDIKVKPRQPGEPSSRPQASTPTAAADADQGTPLASYSRSSQCRPTAAEIARREARSASQHLRPRSRSPDRTTGTAEADARDADLAALSRN